MKTLTKAALFSSILLSSSAFATAFPLDAPKDIDSFVMTAGSANGSTETTVFVAPLDAPKDIIAAGWHTASTHVTSIAGLNLFPLQAPKDLVGEYIAPSQSPTKASYAVVNNDTAFINPLDAPKDRADLQYFKSHYQTVASSGYRFVNPLDAPKDVRENQLNTSFDSKKSSYVFVNPLEAPKDKVVTSYCDLNEHGIVSGNSNGGGWAAISKQC